MTTLAALTTPCLLLEDEKLQANMDRLARRLHERGVSLRPHLKTCKNIEIARRCMESPTGPATVSTLAEAEYFAAGGVRDICYAVGIAPNKLERVAELRRRGIDLSVVLDNEESARLLVDFARQRDCRLAEETGVGKKAILEQMTDVLRSTQRRDRRKEQRDLAGQGNAADIRVPYSAGGDAALGAASAGRQLIAALLQSPEKIPYVRQRLNMDAVVLPEMQEALRAIFRCADEQLPVNITSLQQMLDDKPMAEVNRAQAVNAGHPLQQEDIDMYLERLDNAKPISQTVKGTTDDQFLSAFSKLRKEKGAADPPQSD